MDRRGRREGDAVEAEPLEGVIGCPPCMNLGDPDGTNALHDIIQIDFGLPSFRFENPPMEFSVLALSESASWRSF
jgi:hypothetical protein